MAKRKRKGRGRLTLGTYSGKVKKKAQKIAGEAYDALRDFSREKATRRAELQKNTKVVLAEFIREHYGFAEGQKAWRKGEVQAIAERTTVGVVARRSAVRPWKERYERVRAKVKGEKPTWYLGHFVIPDPKKPTKRKWIREKQITAGQASRAKGMIAYWNKVRILKRATGWDTAKARLAVREMDRLKMWRTVDESPKVLPGEG